jgi:hypothetical protein
MAIAQSDLKFYRSATVSDAATNGGRMSATQVISGAAANLFEAVGGSERTAGSEKFRKLFCKNANDDDIALQYAKIFIDKNTPGDDRFTFFGATQIDTQADILGSEKQYGAGVLAGNVIAGATTLDVIWESLDAAPEDGDLLRITDKADINAAGNEEFVLIDGAPVGSGLEFTVSLATALQNGYSASNTRVAQVYEPLDPNEVDSDPALQNQIKARITGVDVTSAAGTLDDAYLLGDNIGSIEQLWTLTFTSGTAYNIVGDIVGSVGSGTISGGASPNNASFSKPYFVLQSAGFGGTWLSGDVIVFETHPSAAPIWVQRVVPAGAAAIGSNTAILALKGESA